jgi:hypothetical protein
MAGRPTFWMATSADAFTAHLMERGAEFVCGWALTASTARRNAEHAAAEVSVRCRSGMGCRAWAWKSRDGHHPSEEESSPPNSRLALRAKRATRARASKLRFDRSYDRCVVGLRQ